MNNPKLLWMLIAVGWCTVAAALIFKVLEDNERIIERRPTISITAYAGTTKLWSASSTNSGFIKFGESNVIMIDWKWTNNIVKE